jgi:hypothetical protein
MFLIETCNDVDKQPSAPYRRPVTPTSTSSFQILSLDGGGLKGLFSAAVLAQLESDTGVELAEHFDLIAGTSTGGLIALGLGAGMRPIDIVEFYVREGPKIFADPVGTKAVRRSYRSKFHPDPLIRALRNCFGDRLLGDSRKRLVIPSYSLADDDVYVFRTPHHQRLKRDYRVEMWRVGMATAAAPTYFPAFRGVDGIPIVDGGVWAGKRPCVYVVEPDVCAADKPRPPHLHADDCLCLYFPDGKEWNVSMMLADTIVPWASEWLFHHEIWVATGEWCGGGYHPARSRNARANAKPPEKSSPECLQESGNVRRNQEDCGATTVAAETQRAEALNTKSRAPSPR